MQCFTSGIWAASILSPAWKEMQLTQPRSMIRSNILIKYPERLRKVVVCDVVDHRTFVLLTNTLILRPEQSVTSINRAGRSNAFSRCSSRISRSRVLSGSAKMLLKSKFGQRSLPHWWCFWSGISSFTRICGNGWINLSQSLRSRRVSYQNFHFRPAVSTTGWAAFEKSRKFRSGKRGYTSNLIIWKVVRTGGKQLWFMA